jgi:hypothetical protein
MLYFFHGPDSAVITHGLIKERIVPPREIDLAIKRRGVFERDPEKHALEEDEDDG